jgi:hypothetical protein
MDHGRALFFVASSTAKPLHDVVQLGIPAGECRQRAGKAAPGVVTGIALQKDLVLAEMVAQLVYDERFHRENCT